MDHAAALLVVVPAGGRRLRRGSLGAIVAHAWFHTDNAEEIGTAQAAFALVRGIRSKPVTAPAQIRVAVRCD